MLSALQGIPDLNDNAPDLETRCDLELVNVKALKLLAAALVLSSAICFALVVSTRESEPVWEEKPLSAWTDDLATGSSKEVRGTAEQAIRHIGLRALPGLLRMLRSTDGFLQRALRHFTLGRGGWQFPPVTARELPAHEQHVRAALAFEALGRIGRPAIPVLRKILLHNSEPEFVADALVGIGPEGVAIILDALPRMSPKSHCPLYLSALKWPSQEAAIKRALLQSIKSQNAEERRCAAEFLGRFKRDAAPSVAVLVSALEDSDFAVRVQAVRTLAELETNAATAIEPLRNVLHRPGWLPPATISNALARIQQQYLPSVER